MAAAGIMAGPALLFAQELGVNMQMRYDTTESTFRSARPSVSSSYLFNNFTMDFGKLRFPPVRFLLSASSTLNPSGSQTSENKVNSMNVSWAHSFYSVNTAYNENENMVTDALQGSVSKTGTKNMSAGFALNKPKVPSLVMNYQRADTNSQSTTSTENRNENFMLGAYYSIKHFQVSLNQSISRMLTLQATGVSKNANSMQSIGFSYNKSVMPRLSLNMRAYGEVSQNDMEQNLIRNSAKTQKLNLDNGFTWHPSRSMTFGYSFSWQDVKVKPVLQGSTVQTNSVQVQYVPSTLFTLQSLVQMQEQKSAAGAKSSSDNMSLSLSFFPAEATGVYASFVQVRSRAPQSPDVKTRSMHLKFDTKLDDDTDFICDYQKSETLSQVRTTSVISNYSLLSRLVNQSDITAGTTFFVSFIQMSSPAGVKKSNLYSSASNISWRMDEKTSFLYDLNYSQNSAEQTSETISHSVNIDRRLDEHTQWNARYAEQVSQNPTAGKTKTADFYTRIGLLLDMRSQLSFEFKETTNNQGEVKKTNFFSLTLSTSF